MKGFFPFPGPPHFPSPSCLILSLKITTRAVAMAPQVMLSLMSRVQSLGSTRWEERSNSQKLSSDLHTQTHWKINVFWDFFRLFSDLSRDHNCIFFPFFTGSPFVKVFSSYVYLHFVYMPFTTFFLETGFSISGLKFPILLSVPPKFWDYGLQPLTSNFHSSSWVFFLKHTQLYASNSC